MSAGIKKDMEAHLRITYGKEFILNEPQLISKSWVIPATTYIARDGYPADDPTMKFDITWDTQQRTYIDNYLARKWSREGREAMERKLREVYGEGNFYIKQYWSGWNDAKDHRFTWEELMKNRAERNLIKFNYFVFFDGELDRAKEAQLAYQVLEENFIDYKVRQYHFTVYYIFKAKKKECMDIWTDEERSRHESDETMYKSGILKDWIRLNYTKGTPERYHGKQLPEVKSADDLLNTRFQIREGK